MVERKGSCFSIFFEILSQPWAVFFGFRLDMNDLLLECLPAAADPFIQFDLNLAGGGLVRALSNVEGTPQVQQDGVDPVRIKLHWSRRRRRSSFYPRRSSAESLWLLPYPTGPVVFDCAGHSEVLRNNPESTEIFNAASRFKFDRLLIFDSKTVQISGNARYIF